MNTPSLRTEPAYCRQILRFLRHLASRSHCGHDIRAIASAIRFNSEYEPYVIRQKAAYALPKPVLLIATPLPNRAYQPPQYYDAMPLIAAAMMNCFMEYYMAMVAITAAYWSQHH